MQKHSTDIYGEVYFLLSEKSINALSYEMLNITCFVATFVVTLLLSILEYRLLPKHNQI